MSKTIIAIIIFVSIIIIGGIFIWNYPEVFNINGGREVEEPPEGEELPEKEWKFIVGLDQYHLSEDFWRSSDFKTDHSGIKFLNYLEENNIKTQLIENKFNAEILENIDVLIITAPNQPIVESEVASIKDFLDQGGGLLIVGRFNTYMGTASILNDFTDKLKLQVNFNQDYIFSNEWTAEIIEHEITSSVEKMKYRGCSLTTDIPVTTLVKQDGKSVYAVQRYSAGRVGVIGGYFMLRGDNFDGCRECQTLNLNLIKWLGTKGSSENGIIGSGAIYSFRSEIK